MNCAARPISVWKMNRRALAETDLKAIEAEIRAATAPDLDTSELADPNGRKLQHISSRKNAPPEVKGCSLLAAQRPMTKKKKQKTMSST
jgi:hypothetical protein